MRIVLGLLLLAACKRTPLDVDAGVASTSTSAPTPTPTPTPTPSAPPSPARACADLPPLPQPVISAAAVRLADGRLLLVGGETADGKATTATWLADLLGHSVKPAAPLPKPRSSHRAVVLADGRVLVVAASDRLPLKKEPLLLFDPVKNTWKSLPSPEVVPQDASVTALPDGRALVAGGIVPDPSGRHQNYVDLVLLVDAKRGKVTVGPPLPQAGVYAPGTIEDEHDAELRGAVDFSPGPGKMALYDLEAGVWGMMDNGFPAPQALAEGAYAVKGGWLEVQPAKLVFCAATP